MPRMLHILASSGLLALAVVTSASAAVPSSGTVSPLSPTLIYTAGPFTGANPSNNVDSEPDCSLVPGTCDDFTLTVDVPPNYFTLNPTHAVIIRIAWPNAPNDFDLYVQNPSTGTSITSSPTSSNPEVALIDPVAQVVRLRVLVFSAVNESFTGTVTLGPRPLSGTGEGHYLASGDIWSCNTHLTGGGILFGHDSDSEPAVKIGKNGVAWVGGIAGVPAGVGVWKITDKCGKLFTPTALPPDAGLGGGDIDLEIAPETNALGNYNIYISSLYLGNITSSTSVDGGQTFVPVVISDPVPVNDRQWNAAYGANTLYLSWRSLNTGNQLFVERSDNGGASFGAPVPVYNDVVGTVLATQLGSMAVDQRPVPAGTLPLMAGPSGEGNVYHGYVLTTQSGTSGNTVYVAVSKNFGTTWTSKLVFAGPIGATYGHEFSWVAVDQAGNVYTAFSDDQNVYYSFSTNQGDTWSRPIRVNNGGDTKRAIFPMLEAGSAGRIVFGWYGTSDSNPSSTTAQWNYFHARCNDALDPVPTIETTRVSDHVVHSGVVCEAGLSCTCCRELAELAEIAIDPTDGSSMITYCGSGVSIARQLSGTSAVAGKTIVDRSRTCPSSLNACGTPPGDPCNPPGVLVVSDPAGDFSPLGSAAYDILEVRMADPGAGAAKRLVVTMQVASIDPDNPPLSSLWRVLWLNPSDNITYFVSMLTCDVTQIPSFDYGRINPTTGIQTSLGAADAGMVFSDGRIQITISPNKVGNPQLGQTLTTVRGTARLFVGAQCTGLITQIDGTGNGTYTLACTPVATLLSSFDIRETGSGVELSWRSDATDAVGSWNVYRAPAAEGTWQRINDSAIPMGGGGRFRWVDAPLQSGTVFYRIAAVLVDGSEEFLQTSRIEIGRSAFSFDLVGANPFSEHTMLSYSLGARVPVRIVVYSVAGRRMRTLVDGVQDPGRYVVAFPRDDSRGDKLSTGVYMAKITAGRLQKTVRVVVLD